MCLMPLGYICSTVMVDTRLFRNPSYVYKKSLNQLIPLISCFRNYPKRLNGYGRKNELNKMFGILKEISGFFNDNLVIFKPIKFS